jgi:hypothetical protein
MGEKIFSSPWTREMLSQGESSHLTDILSAKKSPCAPFSKGWIKRIVEILPLYFLENTGYRGIQRGADPSGIIL